MRSDGFYEFKQGWGVTKPFSTALREVRFILNLKGGLSYRGRSTF